MTKRIPKVSIIIATYNRAYILGKSMQSVLTQTYRDFELIVVNDGSTDNTEKVVKSFDGEVVKYIRHGENKGIAAARNTGIKSAVGDYIALQDSDDEWLPEKLERQMKVFEKAPSEVDVVYTGFYRIINNRKQYIPSASLNQKQGDIFSSLLKGNFVGAPTVLAKKECFERAGGFDESFPALTDWELFIRIARHFQFRCIDEPLVVSYQQPDSISVNAGALIRAYELLLKKHFADFSKDRRTWAIHLFNIGHLLCSNGELSQGRSYFIRCIKAYPANINSIGAYLVSLFGQSMYSTIVQKYSKIRRR